MKRLYTSLLLLFVSCLCVAQHSHRAYRKLADSLYLHHHYEHAANYYQRALKNATRTDSIMLQIAKCFSRTNNAAEAEEWFQKAKTQQARFSPEDHFQHVNALKMLRRYNEATEILQAMLDENPNGIYTQTLLNDLKSIHKYYVDSVNYLIKRLSISTSVSEFAPAYYKNGIVFSSAKPEHFAKKRYHWDNSHFLNLFYSAKSADTVLMKPVPFHKDLNTRFHDGPVTFYHGFEKMIVNRNQPFKVAEKKDSWIWHMTLFDGQRSAANGDWTLTPLPFDEPYAFIHPSISEDGSVLYFASDKPGGYGGTDIYRVMKEHGIWSEPFNLGPTINTPENEVFPFILGNTLFFSSNGHGGLGGLDIYKSTQNINGFIPPVNLGYPINSHVDDFSFITVPDHQSGYFSSARTGNDDLFFFQLQSEVTMRARIFDGVTRKAIAGADIQLISTNGDDTTLKSDRNGMIHFNLPDETAYILIGNKDGKIGMISGTATPEEDHLHVIHQIAVYGDTTRVPCIGTIRNEDGLTANANTIQITDETTGEKILHSPGQTLINFLGEKGHSYKIEIHNSYGDTTVHTLTLNHGDTQPLTWSMVLKETPPLFTLAAKIFNEADNQPLGGAAVRVVTFAEPDRELRADENGLVEFSLPREAAYIIVGSKDGLTGMNSGIADEKISKTYITHPVPARGDPLKPVPVVALIADSEGKILNDAEVTVTDKLSGESVPVKADHGVLEFFGEHGKEYNIKIEHTSYLTTLEEIKVTKESPAIEKISVVMAEREQDTSDPIPMAVRILKDDQSTWAETNVKVISFATPDLDLTSDVDGVAEFMLPEGSAYMVIAEKDGFTGMHSGIVGKNADKSAVIHPVILHKNQDDELPVLSLVVDETGSPLKDAVIQISDVHTGETIPAKYDHGVLYFPGKKGSTYKIEASSTDFETHSSSITIAEDASMITPLEITLKASPKKLHVTTIISGDINELLDSLAVTVKDKVTGEEIPAEIVHGKLTFPGEQGKQYSLTVTHKEHVTVTEEILIPAKAVNVKDINIQLQKTSAIPPPVLISMAARIFREDDNTPLAGAQVKIMSIEADMEVTTDAEGITEFTLPEGTAYIVVGTKDNYSGMHTGMAEKGAAKTVVTHPVPAHDNTVRTPVVTKITDDNGLIMDEVQVTVTEKNSGKKVPSEFLKGVLSFYADKGKEYSINAKSPDHLPSSQHIAIASTSSEIPRFTMELSERDPVPDSHSIAVQALIEKNKSPLEGAEIRIMSSSDPDIELVAGKNGVAEFNLPDGAAYIVIVSKDGYTGMHTGIADKQASKAFVTHPVPAVKQKENELPVLAMIVDNTGSPVQEAEVNVTNGKTGDRVKSKIENGILFFNGKKGNNYRIEVNAEGYQSAHSSVSIDASAKSMQPLEINLKRPDKTPLSSPLSLPADSKLIVLRNGSETDKFYVLSEGAHYEIIEHNDSLFMSNDHNKHVMGKGSIREIRENPASFIEVLKLSSNEVITLQNIYFDFNKTTIDDASKPDLEKVVAVLKNYPFLHLTIRAHADDRGDDNYNLALSKRRARAIGAWLSKEGIAAERLNPEALGEAAPEVPCHPNCSEEDYRKNRRAEFILSTVSIKTPSSAAPDSSAIIAARPNSAKRTDSRPQVEKATRIIEKYREAELQGLTFKIAVGAYRLNPTLTFTELTDLGTIEKRLVGGINYYYLGDFPSMKVAEEIRKQVIIRGVKDAYVSYFYNGEKISFQRFAALIQETETQSLHLSGSN